MTPFRGSNLIFKLNSTKSSKFKDPKNFDHYLDGSLKPKLEGLAGLDYVALGQVLPHLADGC